MDISEAEGSTTCQEIVDAEQRSNKKEYLSTDRQKETGKKDKKTREEKDKKTREEKAPAIQEEKNKARSRNIEKESEEKERNKERTIQWIKAPSDFSKRCAWFCEQWNLEKIESSKKRTLNVPPSLLAALLKQPSGNLWRTNVLTKVCNIFVGQGFMRENVFSAIIRFTIWLQSG